MSIFHGRNQHKANEVSRSARNINGLSKFLGSLLSLGALSASAQTANVVLAWNGRTDSAIAGYKIYSGEVSGVYTSSTNAGSNLTALRQSPQTLLHRDTNIASGAARTVSVDDLKQNYFSLTCNRDLAIQALQSLLHRRHIGL